MRPEMKVLAQPSSCWPFQIIFSINMWPCLFFFFLVRAAIQFTWGLHLNVILVYIFLVLGRGRRTLDCLA